MIYNGKPTKSFVGQFAFLSNMYGCNVHVNGLDYPSLESAYQSFKELDKTQRLKFTMMNGYQAKKYWQDNPSPKRPDWDDIKFEIMKTLIKIKFHNPDLRTRLLATGNMELVEMNWWHDRSYGICTCNKCKGQGQNKLGKLLMEARTFYQLLS